MLPMLNSLPSIKSVKKDKSRGPSVSVLNSIFNYSKSIETTSIKDGKILIHLN